MRFFTLLRDTLRDTFSIKKNVFILVLLFTSLQFIFIKVTSNILGKDLSIVSTVLVLTTLILFQFFHFVFLYFFRHKTAKTEIVVKEVSTRFIKLLMATALLMTAAVIGSLLFVIPGLLVISLLFLVQPIILFENKPIFEAMRQSYRRTKTILLPIAFPCSLLYVAGLLLTSNGKDLSLFWSAIYTAGTVFFYLFYFALMQRVYSTTHDNEAHQK